MNASRFSQLRGVITDDRWLILRRAALIAAWTVLAVITHIPIPQSAPSIGGIDKVVHLIGYFPLGLLLPVCRVRGCQRGVVCLLVIALYGVADELLQIPVGRTASVLDWIADMTGAALGIVTVTWLLKR